MKIRDKLITEILYRVCVKGEPIKVVASELPMDASQIMRWVNRYEAREVAA